MKLCLVRLLALFSVVGGCASAPPVASRSFELPRTMMDGPAPRKVAARAADLDNAALAVVPPAAVLDYSQAGRVRPKTVERTLPSGLRLVVRTDRSYPAVEMAVVVGRRRSDPTPAALLVQTMLDGWASHSNGGPDVYDAGIVSTSLASDSLVFQLDSMSNLFPTIGSRFLQRLTRTDFERRGVEHTKANLVLAASHPTAPQIASRALWRSLYPSPNGYGDQIANATELEPVSTSDVEALRSALMVKDNLIVTAIGDIDIDALGAMVEREFKALPNTTTRAAAKEPDASTCSGKIILLDRPGAQQASVRLGWPTVPAAHADAPALRFLAAISGTTLESRLNRSVRAELGASYGVRAYASFFKEGGAFLLETSLDPTKVGAALGQIDTELTRLSTETPKKGETAGGIARSDVTGHDSASSLGLARYRMQNEAAPKVDDAKAAAQRYLTTSRRCMVVVGDAKTLEPELAHFGEVVVGTASSY